MDLKKVGIIGGTGLIGGALCHQVLQKSFIEPQKLWVSNQKGVRTAMLDAWPLVTVTNNNADLIEHCQTIVLSVRPHQLRSLQLVLKDKFVISVMAGVSIQKIQELTQAHFVVRAMPNAASEIAESYTPWYANDAVTQEMREFTKNLFATIGQTDQLKRETEVDFFTALTGSGQGWVAYFEQCLIDVAIKNGVDKKVSEHAIRQLFLGMGKMLAHSEQPISVLIDELIAYAGTTAAGLRAMKKSAIAEDIADSLEASYQKASSDMT